MSDMTKEPGWYWFRWRDGEWKPCRVLNQAVVRWWSGEMDRMEDVPGLGVWGPRIPEPHPEPGAPDE